MTKKNIYDEEIELFDDYILNESFENIDVEALKKEIDKKNGIFESSEFLSKDGKLETKLTNTVSRELYTNKNKDDVSKLNQNQLKAIELSINGVSQNKIASIIGVSKASVSGWFKNDDFINMLEKVQKEQIRMFKNHFISKVPSAIKELERIIANPNTKDENKLRAISMIFEYAGVKENIKDQTNINNVASIVVNVMPKKEILENIESENDIIEVEYQEKDYKMEKA